MVRRESGAFANQILKSQMKLQEMLKNHKSFNALGIFGTDRNSLITTHGSSNFLTINVGLRFKVVDCRLAFGKLSQ